MSNNLSVGFIAGQLNHCEKLTGVGATLTNMLRDNPSKETPQQQACHTLSIAKVVAIVATAVFAALSVLALASALTGGIGGVLMFILAVPLMILTHDSGRLTGICFCAHNALSGDNPKANIQRAREHNQAMLVGGWIVDRAVDAEDTIVYWGDKAIEWWNTPPVQQPRRKTRA